ncbi:AAA family ATPase [Streptosporangium jomthongense]|uniref:Nuclease SbcCD subunit C n=1 Tax=Streptosporangium jomthongense TaxID=1193683 RepID=A0ABV8F237_9ACTN
MLVFHRLTIENFGPYFGTQSLDFEKSRGVYIVYGQNGQGKTKLHNAFRWALYGRIFGRRGEAAAADLVNSEARKQIGYGKFATILEFSHENSRYRLTRRYDENSDPSIMLRLEKDGTPVSQTQAERLLQTIAPVSISQFFLFDGELLRQYEDLLDKGSEEGAKLEEAIERVLGVPIVANARRDIEEVRKAAGRRLADLAAANEKTQRLGIALREAQDLRDELLKEFSKQKREVRGHEERIGVIEEKLREAKRSERLLTQLDMLRNQEAELLRKITKAEEDLAQSATELWQVVLAAPARRELVNLQRDLRDTDSDLHTTYASLRDLYHLESRDDCPVCASSLDAADKAAMLQRIRRSASSERREALERQRRDVQERMEILQGLAGHDGRLVRERDKSLRNLRLELDTAQTDIRELEEELADIADEQEVRRLVKERKERQDLVGRLKGDIDSIARQIQDKELAIDDLQANLSKNRFSPEPATSRKEDVSRKLSTLFERSIDVYRDKLRLRVEETASNIFRRIASEPDYNSLKITEHYGLEILDLNGQIVSGRSAGYEHLVALSLIAALQHSASVRGPVVMDSPFGRLDHENTRKVVAALPQMADQVILLAFKGEFDEREAARALDHHLIAEYELERVSSRHTKIVPKGYM